VILVDSSVWIDFFKGADNPATQQLTQLLSGNVATVVAADLVIFEVLRGFRHGPDLLAAQRFLSALPQVELGGLDNALLAAEHYRILRSQGYTIRSPIDVLLASYCITHQHTLLHRDADFDVMETLRGLKVWKH
jgi:predicted nucleic acid-binding protein